MVRKVPPIAPGADELTLHLGKVRMVVESGLHLSGTQLKRRQKIAVAPAEAIQRFSQDLLGAIGAERRDPINDPVRRVLIGLVALPRLNRRLERPHQHARRVWAKLERLAAKTRRVGHLNLWV